jgi:hypothetical protein
MSLQRWPLGFNDSPSYAAPLTPWASFPAALTAEGQIRRPAELPRVELIALGGIWRPRGGRQVLAQRGNNPVTVQSLSAQIAETLGPFPGGLVRSGMQLVLNWWVDHSGIGTGGRTARLWANDGVNRSKFMEAVLSSSGASHNFVAESRLIVRSDTNAAHVGALNGSGSFSPGQFRFNPTINFASPFTVEIEFISCAETAVNIASATWAAGVATYNTSAPSTLVTGDKTVIASVSPSGWNIAAGAIVTRIDDDTFTVPMAADPGAYVSGGTSARTSNMKSESYILTLEG